MKTLMAFRIMVWCYLACTIHHERDLLSFAHASCILHLAYLAYLASCMVDGGHGHGGPWSISHLQAPSAQNAGEVQGAGGCCVCSNAASSISMPDAGALCVMAQGVYCTGRAIAALPFLLSLYQLDEQHAAACVGWHGRRVQYIYLTFCVWVVLKDTLLGNGDDLYWHDHAATVCFCCCCLIFHSSGKVLRTAGTWQFQFAGGNLVYVLRLPASTAAPLFFATYCLQPI